jgi:hypothetical protein
MILVGEFICVQLILYQIYLSTVDIELCLQYTQLLLYIQI